MAQTGKTRVEVLTGFLGSGKTTLLSGLLSQGGFADTAVVVNEIGEIGLDHLLVERRTEQVALLEGGCLCCEVVDSLPETLLELCRGRAGGDLPPFSRIVIETTGLADPGPILSVLRGSSLLAHFLEPGLVVAALDMTDAEAVTARHPEALHQLLLADRVVLTKLDLRGPLTTGEEGWLEGLNPIAEVVSAQDVAADPAILLAAPPARHGAAAKPGREHAARGHHTHGVQAHDLEVRGDVTRAGLAAFAAAIGHVLGDRLLRCKGVVECGGDPVLVQGVRKRFDFAAADARQASVAGHLTCIVQDCEREEIEPLLDWLSVPEGTMPPGAEDVS
ncbi:hypothetical protein B2G71_17705 [Novosphingobium sp. PC22D]|uniref:CobW family GTP-binding protein n=1 Tax=Novosphingobium sp. PC22D TaxID=1962403 RepID=UPI000BEF7B7A|nr:GTP-binding protein [Novosphingobium sp. PC22D]PEQ11388.1 hypothetical protein B2G71_17705 [Novosphingobium sp. PC22D]